MTETSGKETEEAEQKLEELNHKPQEKQNTVKAPYVKQAIIGKFMDQFLPQDVFSKKGGRTVCLVCEKENGKSNLTWALVKHGGFKFDQVWVITLDTDGELAQLVSFPEMVLNNVNEAFFKKLIRLQAETPKKKRKRILIIFDDFIGIDMNMRQSLALKELATRNRHLQVSILFSTQKFRELPDVFRKNGQWWFMGKNSTASIDQLVQELASAQLDKPRMRALLLRIAAEDNFEFLAVKNCRPGGIVHFRPPLLKPESDDEESDDSDHEGDNDKEPGEPSEKRQKTS